MKWIFVFAILSLPVFAAEVENRVGKIYALDGPVKGEPLFTQKIRVESDGNIRRSKSTIEDADHKVVMTENAYFIDGKIVEQNVEQLQIGERYELRAKDGQISYRTFKIGEEGKLTLESDKSEKAADAFLTGPGTEPFLKSQDAHFIKGETVVAQFGVFEIGRSVAFEFHAEARGPAADGPMKVRMEPKSFWLSMLVSPMQLELEPGTYRMTRYKGRTPVRVKKGSSWKALDADILYTSTIEKK